MAHDDTQLFCSGLCSICSVPGDFLRRSDEGWICDSCYSKGNITMATKTKNNPTTITDENSLEIYSWCPKRVLFDALFGVVDGDSDDEKMREIIRLTNDLGAIYGKKVLKSFSFVKPGKEEPEADEAGHERFTDEIPVTVVEEAPLARAASVEGPAPRAKKKATSKKKAAAKKFASKK